MSKLRRYAIVGAVGTGELLLIACIGGFLGSLFQNHDLAIIVSLVFGGFCGPMLFGTSALLNDKLKEYRHV